MEKIALREVFGDAWTLVKKCWRVYAFIMVAGLAMMGLFMGWFVLTHGTSMAGIGLWVDIVAFLAMLLCSALLYFAELHYSVTTLRGEGRFFPRKGLVVRVLLFIVWPLILILAVGLVLAGGGAVLGALVGVSVGGLPFGGQAEADPSVAGILLLVLFVVVITVLHWWILTRLIMLLPLGITMGEVYSPLRIWRLTKKHGGKIFSTLMLLPGVLTLPFSIVFDMSMPEANAAKGTTLELSGASAVALWSLLAITMVALSFYMVAMVAAWYNRLYPRLAAQEQTQAAEEAAMERQMQEYMRAQQSGQQAPPESPSSEE